MALPEVYVHQAGDTLPDTNIGKIGVAGEVFTRAEINDFIRTLQNAVDVAKTLGTKVFDSPGILLPTQGLRLTKHTAWEGTYSTTVEHMLADLLTDGSSVPDVWVQHYHNGGERTMSGTLVQISERKLIFEDGHAVSIDEVFGVCVGD